MPKFQGLLTKIPNDLIFDRHSGQFTLLNRKSTILIYGSHYDHSDPDKSELISFNVIGQVHPFNKELKLFASPKLYKNDHINERTNVYYFGIASAQSGNPISIITVNWGSNQPTNIELQEPTTDLYFEIGENESFRGHPNGKNEVKTTESFLYLDVIDGSQATIQIAQNLTQANAIVLIFDKKGTCLGRLDPTKPGQSLILTQDAWVIPFIGPTQKITFEVGDPEDDGEVEYEDE